ncbi:bifunctional diacylglycerol diphosphate phosphatase/phosphatidate phosphatase [Dermatophagoides pteronyssinus]|uniref:Bifunctional diacylglycerol diphosphate phosphatase/phosphatidate phosphatase n=1 Tax=Dermatophagoides pteronyssinus TaxID=6956 RepID=A0ABQ8JDB9_DERPT|nr:bifunctional diacylglycerol diphosphate phosphatase/phosphatidate phosphatase [Dermatophagoides pteronyssinus]
MLSKSSLIYGITETFYNRYKIVGKFLDKQGSFKTNKFFSSTSINNSNNKFAYKSDKILSNNLFLKNIIYQRNFRSSSFTMASTQKSSEYIYTNDTPVIQLEATSAFEALTVGEKKYAHYLSKASWFGSLAVLYQTSPESPLIFALFRRLFAMESFDQLKSVAMEKCEFSEEDWRSFLIYVAAFYSNMGNYRGFGDSKFIPNVSKNKLDRLIKSSQAYQKDPKFMELVWNNVCDKIFSLNPDELSLGFQPDGTTTYWSKNMTEEDEKIVKKFLTINDIEAYNTRALKDPKTGQYVIRFASIRSSSDPEERDYINKVSQLEMDGHSFRLERGDYSPILSLVNENLIKAGDCAQNQTERKMVEEYVRHFRSGSLDAHKEGSRHWIKDKKPIVETYIGFIETYRDPAGQRAEFEGFVAIVNKEMSKKFTSLVDNASQLLPLLPWPKEFEMDRFLQPDFTSLDILTFSGSGVPAGINIPNYNEIKQNEGFKNVSLGNVITASLKATKPNFLNDDDAKLLDKYRVASFEIIVGLHELLGHGSGKLFRADKDGKLNFDQNKTINPLTGKPVNKWYEHGESYDGKFGAVSSAYEECRAECVGLYLSLNSDVLTIFGFNDQQEAHNAVYVAWLEMVQKGIESLKMYNPSVKKWLQAHSQARYVITRVLLESAKEMVSIDQIEQSPTDGKPDLLINFTRDHKLIETKGRKAIGDFLLKLQIYKSTGDNESAQKMFDYYSAVNDDLEYPYLRFRDIVIDRKKPRRLFVESSTQLDSDNVGLKSFESSPEGLISSFQEHFSNDQVNIETILVDLWQKDRDYFN